MEMNKEIATNSKLEMLRFSAEDLSEMLFELVEKEYFSYVRELFADDYVTLVDDLSSGKGVYPSDYIKNLAKAAMMAGAVVASIDESVLDKNK